MTVFVFNSCCFTCPMNPSNKSSTLPPVEGQWPAPVDVDWTANLASGQTQDHGSTSDTLEVSGSDGTHRVQTHKLSSHAFRELSADTMTWERRTCTQWEIGMEGQPEGVASQLVSMTRPSDGYNSRSMGSERCQTGALLRTSNHERVPPVLPHVSNTDCVAEAPSVSSFEAPRQQDAHEPQGTKPTQKLFPCLLCGRTFRCPTQVEIHHRVHTGERPFRCTLCPASFSVSGNLKRHQRVHTGEKPFSCPQCGRHFSLRHQLQKHLRCHSGEKPFSCFRCGRRFADKSYVRRHLQKAHSIYT